MQGKGEVLVTKVGNESPTYLSNSNQKTTF